jgi:uncharacterized protein (DUF2062 family)
VDSGAGSTTRRIHLPHPSLKLCVLVVPGGERGYEGAVVDGMTVLEMSVQESLQSLPKEGFTHVIVASKGFTEGSVHALRLALEVAPEQVVVAVPDSGKAPFLSAWALRVASGWQLSDPRPTVWAYPLSIAQDRHLFLDEPDVQVELMIKLAWAGVERLEVPVEGHVRSSTARFRRRRLHMFVRLICARMVLPQAFLDFASRRSFHELNLWERLKTTGRELFLREPGSSARIGASAGVGFFVGLTPLWGFQILLTLFLSHRLRLSKPIALLCAHIAIPPLIPMIIYVSLVIGRVLLGGEAGEASTSLELAPSDMLPWFVGSFVLAVPVGLFGGLSVWALVRLARRLRGESSEDPETQP